MGGAVEEGRGWSGQLRTCVALAEVGEVGVTGVGGEGAGCGQPRPEEEPARRRQQAVEVLHTEKSSNVFRVGTFLEFVWGSGTTRTMHPRWAYVRRAEQNRIDPHRGRIERTIMRTVSRLVARWSRLPGTASR